MKAPVWARASVIGLALSFSAPALADEPAPNAPPSAEPATPLATRPSKPLALAKPPESTPIGYKLVLGLGIAAAAALWLKNKRKAIPSAKPRSVIDVVGRTSVGVRSELLVVDVEGTRLLVGMTPSAISTLAVLETPEDDGSLAIASSSVSSSSSSVFGSGLDREPEALGPLDDRVRSLFESRASLPGVEKPTLVRAPKSGAKRAPRVASAPKTPRVAGQAKGLLLALEEPKPESKS